MFHTLKMLFPLWRERGKEKKLNGDKFDDAVFEEDYSDARDVKDF